MKNICDNSFLGIGPELNTFGPLLQPVTVNQHATLIAYFVRTVLQTSNKFIEVIAPRNGNERDVEDMIGRAQQYVPELDREDAVNGAKLLVAMMLLNDTNWVFDRYTLYFYFFATPKLTRI